MSREIISDKQGITIVILFLLGSALLFSSGAQAKQDLWLAHIAATLIALPILLIYARLLSLFPGKDLFDILPLIFGKLIGKGLSLLYVWYAFHLGSLVIRNFGEFINVVSLPETPMIVPMICLTLLCVWGVKEGIEVIGRWGEYFLPIIIFIMLFATVLSIPKMDLDRLRPVLYEGIQPVMVATFSILTFPFAETVIFTMVFSCLKSKKSAYTVFIAGLLIGALLILITSTRNVLVLGVDMTNIQFFPSYTAVATINIGDFLERVEIIVSVTFLIGGFVKISMCLLAVCNGIAKIFAFDDYRFMVLPIALLMINFAYLVYDSTMEMVQWLTTYSYYAFPFQVILPLIILVVAEIRIRSPQFQVNKLSQDISAASLIAAQENLQTLEHTITESTKISEDLSQVASKLKQLASTYTAADDLKDQATQKLVPEDTRDDLISPKKQVK